jgi:hypothetical protein
MSLNLATILRERASISYERHGTFLAAASLQAGGLFALVACAGCGGATVGEAGAAGSTQDATPTPDAPTVSVQGVALTSKGSPVAGVSVCLLQTTDHANCTTSDADGAWALAGAPADELVAITFVKEGFFPTLRPVVTARQTVKLTGSDASVLASGDWDGALVSVLENPAAAAGAMGTALDPNVGHIAFLTATGGAEPTTPAAVTLGGTNKEEAPFFVDASGSLLNQTSGTRGLFVNLPPGLYVVTFEGASGGCQAHGGLYGAPIATARGVRLMVPVVAGFVTLPVAVDCEAGA